MPKILGTLADLLISNLIKDKINLNKLLNQKEGFTLKLKKNFDLN